jgi:DNA-binding NtrC family response regulator
LAARAIHYRGARRDGPFVPVNCGAIPDTLVENELFGHHRGAYTDARVDHAGLVELAHGGTLFLDEVDALTPKAQVTLLRFLQDRQYRPLGARREKQADVRIIAAANRNLERQVAAGEFRIDLLYRLQLLHLTLPPLRDRAGDAALLAEHFVKVAAAQYGIPAAAIEPATLAWFECYAWPGNIRELENVVQRGFLFSEGKKPISIDPPQGLAETRLPDAPTLDFRQAKTQAIAKFEYGFLANLIGQTKGNVTAAARISGTERRYLGRLLKKYRIPKHSPRA